MSKIVNKSLGGRISFIQKCHQVRNLPFTAFLNQVFNSPDPERIKLVGPDRACAEWALKNGGKIVWTNGVLIADYNLLPKDGDPVPHVAEIDATESSMSYYGFPHLRGCRMLTKITLHNSMFIENKAMKGLAFGKDTLKHVQVSKCHDVSDEGLKEIKSLQELETLVLFDLSNVKNMDECVQYLKSQLPKCKIITNQVEK